MSKTKKKTAQRREFTDQQKAAAVKRLRDSGLTFAAVAKEAGVADSVLRRWVLKADVAQGVQSQRKPSPRAYTEQEKRDAIEAVRTSGVSQDRTAAQLGIPVTSIRRWINAAKDGAKQPKRTTAQTEARRDAERAAELDKLRKQNGAAPLAPLTSAAPLVVANSSPLSRTPDSYSDLTNPEREELIGLRLEVQRLAQERDVLKQAARLFARDTE